MAAPAYPLSSVDRALSLIALLGEREPLRVHDVAKELGVAPSTAHRLLAMLVHHGFAVQDRRHAYWPGPTLELAQRAARPTAGLIRASAPALRALSAATGEASHLMVLEGAGVRFLFGVEGRPGWGISSRVNKVLPAHLTSGGKALLATLTHDELDQLYPRGLRLTNAAAGPDLAKLLRELALTRRRGFGMNVEETERGICGIGAAVLDPGGRGIAAVAVAAPRVRTLYRELMSWGQLATETARGISRALSDQVPQAVAS